MDLLSDILARMKMRGTLYFRTEFTSPWGVRVPRFENVARFHVAHRGRCWAVVEGVTAPVLLEKGDLIIIPHGAAHVLADPADAEIVELDHVLEKSGFKGEGALIYGGSQGHHATELICGHFAFAAGAQHPLLASLPPCIHLKNYSENVQIWLQQTLNVIGSEVTGNALGTDLIALKLSETICAQAIRSYLISEGKQHLVAAGFTDPKISAALNAMHQQPSRRWTLADLAQEAGQSRTAFAERFKAVMGEAPLEYLTEWRMQIARGLLTETEAPMIEIAEQVGYQSETAFSRVFKRCVGRSPAALRRLARP